MAGYFENIVASFVAGVLASQSSYANYPSTAINTVTLIDLLIVAGVGGGTLRNGVGTTTPVSNLQPNVSNPLVVYGPNGTAVPKTMLIETQIVANSGIPALQYCTTGGHIIVASGVAVDSFIREIAQIYPAPLNGLINAYNGKWTALFSGSILVRVIAEIF